jgi:hypothetical protein
VDSLNLIHDTATRARRAVVAGYAGNLLILWGLVWIAGFTAGHFSPHQGGRIFVVLDGLGIVGTVLLCRKWPARASVTGLTLFGYYALPGHFNLWMASTAAAARCWARGSTSAFAGDDHGRV